MIVPWVHLRSEPDPADRCARRECDRVRYRPARRHSRLPDTRSGGEPTRLPQPLHRPGTSGGRTVQRRSPHPRRPGPVCALVATMGKGARWSAREDKPGRPAGGTACVCRRPCGLLSPCRLVAGSGDLRNSRTANCCAWRSRRFCWASLRPGTGSASPMPGSGTSLATCPSSPPTGNGAECSRHRVQGGGVDARRGRRLRR